MISVTKMNQTPTNSEGHRTPARSVVSDEEYVYESDTDEDVKVAEVNPARVNHSINPFSHPDSSTNIGGRTRGNPRVISDWFTNMGSMMGLKKKTLVYKPKKSFAFIIESNYDMMKCNITINGLTHFEQSNHDVQMKLMNIDFTKFSLGNGQICTISTPFSKWIINDYEPHMWREVGIYIYTMFGGKWDYITVFKAKSIIEQCLKIWKKIQKEVYISFCEIVIERKFTDEKPVPDNMKNQIDRAMWKDAVKEEYKSGFLAFQDWYKSKLIELIGFEKDSKVDKETLFHHMLNFCGMYTMNKSSSGIVTNIPGLA